MLKSPRNRLLLSLRLLRQSADHGDLSDADLLERFVSRRDEAAFEALLNRHGEMVLRVCGRHLANPSDAEDAFQAVFLVLARDAGRIGRRESLAGWLFRVSYYISRKLMGKNARHRTVTLRDSDRASDAMTEIDRAELRTIVEVEVNALPDKFRAAVVLCYLEGRSNSEAAALLGCPRGTVDSRLATARQKLHQRLVRRGVALSGAAVAGVWQGDGQAAAAGLTARTLGAACQYARIGSAAGAVSSEVLSLVAGVSNTMTASKLSVFVALAVGLSLLGGAGYTAFRVSADSPKRGDTKPAEKSKPPQSLAERGQEEAAPPAKLEATKSITDQEIRALLSKPAGLKELDQMDLRSLLEYLSDRFNVPIRIDLAAFARMRIPQAIEFYKRPVSIPIIRGMTVGDILREALAQIEIGGGGEGGGGATGGQVTFRIRNGQIAIVPAYVPFLSSVGNPPGNTDDPNIGLTPSMILEQEEGEPITISIEEKPLVEVLQELRHITGANIVLDARQKDKAKLAVTATFNDVRLLAALRVLSDMSDLQPVPMNNVYYITSRENAERLQKEFDRRRYGDPPNWPQQQWGLGGLGGFGLPGGAGASPPSAPKPEEKKPEEKK